MHIEMDVDTCTWEVLVLAVLVTVTFYLIWSCSVSSRDTSHSQTVPEHVNGEHDFSDVHPHDHGYVEAARHALQKHAALITNVNPGEIAPQLYSDCLISGETFSLISTHNGTNRHKMLIVFGDLQSRVALNPFSLLKFVNILRGYEEYEELANHLQSTFQHQCAERKLEIPKVDMPVQDTTDGENNGIPFKDQIPAGQVLLEVKFNTSKSRGHCLNLTMKKFTQHCDITDSFCGLLLSKDSTTANFHVPTKSVSTVEKKITDSEHALTNMNIFYVKISGKTVYDCEKDSAKPKKSPLVSGSLGCELEAVGPRSVDCQFHGLLQVKMSRSGAVLYDGKICIGGGTTGSYKQDLYKVITYHPDTHQTSWISTLVKFFSLVIVNDQLTIVGGCLENATCSDKVYSWDEAAKQWKEHFPPMPTPRRSTTPVVFENYLIVLGGAQNTATVVEVLDLQSHKWYTAPSLPETMYHVQAVVTDNTLYLLGGAGNSVWSCSLPTLITAAMSALDSLSQLWKRLANLPYNFSAAALLGKHLLAIGGHDEAATNTTDSIHSFFPESNCWGKVGSLRTGRRNCAAVKTADDKLFVVGGADSPAFDSYCDNVEMLCIQR